MALYGWYQERWAKESKIPKHSKVNKWRLDFYDQDDDRVRESPGSPGHWQVRGRAVPPSNQRSELEIRSDSHGSVQTRQGLVDELHRSG